MPFLIGGVLAIAVGIMATVVGLDRDRAFYPTVAIVVASYYALFAIMGGSMPALAVESIVALVFLGAAIAGFRTSLWWAVGALLGHGLFDAIHGHLVANPGVPAFWPAFCGTYDVAAGVFLALLLVRRRHASFGRSA